MGRDKEYFMNKLGKKPATVDERDITFQLLKDAFPIKFPVPPNRFGHGLAYKDWRMLGNGPDDSVEEGFQGCGCCVLSDAAHVTMLTNKLAGHDVKFTGKEVVKAYSDITGYVIGDDSTDQGTEMREALKYRQKYGIMDASGRNHKIGAYVSINPKDPVELAEAVYVFTAVSIGFEFPDYAWSQFDNHEVWDVIDGDSVMDGGHDIPIVGRYSLDNIAGVTWGERHGLTRSFYEATNDETWAIVFPEELRKGKTERGYDLSTLTKMLGSLT
jgi:hypothetical protein